MPSLIKEMMAEEIRRAFTDNPYAFITSCDGLPVADLSEFRRGIEKVSTRTLMVKHTIAEKVLKEMNLGDAVKFFKGSVLITFGSKEPQAISKTLMALVKTNQKIVPAGVVFEKQIFDQAYVKQLAMLPSRHELLTQVVVRVKSPISGFVLTLNQVLRGFVVALNEVKKKKEAGASAAA